MDVLRVHRQSCKKGVGLIDIQHFGQGLIMSKLESDEKIMAMLGRPVTIRLLKHQARTTQMWDRDEKR